MKTIIPYVVLSFVLFGCADQNETKTIDFRTFTMQTPLSWEKFKLAGVDSYLGGLSNGTDSLIFDYGSSVYNFSDLDTLSHKFSFDTINGKPAVVIRPITKGQGVIGVYIENVRYESDFMLTGSNIKDEDVLLEIFKSIIFDRDRSRKSSKNFGENY